MTVLREAQAYGVWFLTYEYLMQHDVARRNLKGRQEVEAYRLAFYGGIAGEALWLGSYPFDVVKSKMQTDGLGVARNRVVGATAANSVDVKTAAAEGATTRTTSQYETVARVLSQRRYVSTGDCFAQTWRDEGLRGFWKGIGPTLLRAMPVSAATFAV